MSFPDLDAIEVSAPSYVMPAAILFTHPSRVTDSWTPLPESVWLPPRQVSSGSIVIAVRPGKTRAHCIPLRPWNLKRILNTRRTLRLADRLVFDARFETDKNVAHQFGSVACRVLLARRELSAALGREVEITVILRDGATGYSQAIHRQLGFPVLTTDSQVDAQLVEVVDNSVSTYQNGRMIFSGGSHASQALTPSLLSQAPLQTRDPGELPEKIFISRRRSRCITNEDEITRILEVRGFRRFYFEEESYERQMLLCRHARAIVAIHGAAMAYMVLNGNGLTRTAGDRSGLRIVELFGPGYSVDCYRRYAAILNAHWCGVRGQITSEVLRDLDERNMPRRHEASSFRVDPMSLEMALDHSERASATEMPLSSD